LENSSAPAVEIRPPVGLKPTAPEKAPGRMVEPFVWLPIAPGMTPAATAAAEPIDDPPGVRARSYGLRVGPGVRNASSAVTVLPMTIAPAASSARTTSDDRAGTRPRKSAEPFSVGMPAVSKMSFTPTGTP